jgi:HK97 family phage major capsid protein
MQNETVTLLKDVQSAFTSFREKNDERLATLEAHLREMETMNARLGGTGTTRTGRTPAAMQALARWARTGDAAAFEGMTPQAGLRVGVDPDGGFLVPEEVSTTIQQQVLQISPIRQIARVIPATAASYKQIVDLRGLESGWVGEVSSRPSTGGPNLSVVDIPAKEVYAMPKATQQLLDDSGFDVGEWLTRSIADEFAQQEGAAFVSGDGVNKPLGFLALDTSTDADDARAFGTLQYTASGGASGFASSDPSDALIDLVYSLKSAYRLGAVWVMNALTQATVRKFKDGQGNYLWERSTQAGQPPMLLGYPVIECPDMPDVGANAFAIAFGNFARAYVVTDRVTRILRDPFTSKPYVNFYATKRVGGGTTDSDAIKLLKIATSKAWRGMVPGVAVSVRPARSVHRASSGAMPPPLVCWCVAPGVATP